MAAWNARKLEDVSVREREREGRSSVHLKGGESLDLGLRLPIPHCYIEEENKVPVATSMPLKCE